MEFTGNFCKTSDKLHFSVVNPVKHPEITKRYTVSGDMITDKTVVFDNGENYKIIPYEEMFSYNYLTGQKNLLVAEEKFSAAVIALNKDNLAKVAFLKGHGEEYDEGLKQRIEDIGAKCMDIDLRNEEISGFDSVMLISPKTDLTAADIEKLAGFLKEDGTVITALDASVPRLETLESFLSEWGIVVERNMVFGTDNKSIMGNQPYSVIGRLNSHPVTDSLIRNNISPVFFASRSVTPLWKARGGITVTVLAGTEDNASAVSIDPDNEAKSGTFALLTLSQGEKGRIFTFGSNMFFSGELKAYNGDLIGNIITLSAGGEPTAEISPKVIESSNIKVPKNDIVLWILIFGLIIPALIAAAGIAVAIRRKNL